MTILLTNSADTLQILGDILYTDKNSVFISYFQPPNRPGLYANPEKFIGKSFKEVMPPHVAKVFEEPEPLLGLEPGWPRVGALDVHGRVVRGELPLHGALRLRVQDMDHSRHCGSRQQHHPARPHITPLCSFNSRSRTARAIPIKSSPWSNGCGTTAPAMNASSLPRCWSGWASASGNYPWR